MKLRKAALALALSALLTVGGGGAAHAHDRPVGSQAQPPSEYVYSVVDTEMPAGVKDRAQAALGSRYVELWIAPDQRSYIVGVLDLNPSEVAKLTSEVRRTAPVSFVNRTVSRAQVDQSLAVVAEYANKVGPKIQTYGPDYVAGNVSVETQSASRSSIESALRSEVKEPCRAF